MASSEIGTGAGTIDLLDYERGKVAFAYFEANVQLLHDIIGAIHEKKKKCNKLTGAYYLFSAAAGSSDSLLILARTGRVRDCAMIARCIFETLVNALYILASDESVVDDLKSHAEMKQARDLDREIQAGGSVLKIRHAARDYVRELAPVKDAIEQFTTSKGAENRQWTAANLRKRLEKIEKEFASEEERVTDIFALAFVNYRFASEVLHGTLYAILEEFGISRLKPVISDDDHLQQLVTHMQMILLTHGGCIDTAANILCQFANLEDYSNRRKEIRRILADAPSDDDKNGGERSS